MNINIFINFIAALCLLALFAACDQVQAQNAQGAPTVTAADGTNLATTAPNEDSQLTATPTGVTTPMASKPAAYPGHGCRPTRGMR